MEGHNATSLSTTQQQASGASIAWALTAIGTNAMLQPSFSSYIEGYSFDGSIWSHRSSPCFCLIDTVADAWMIAQSMRRTSEQTHERNLAKPAIVLTRMAIFVLGVLPQALQLFSMRGIPGTQSIAAIFLLATLLSMARSIRAEAPLDEIVQLKARIERSTFVSLKSIQLLTFLVGGGTHLMMMLYLWHHMAPDLRIGVSDDVHNVTRWIRSILIVLSWVYVVQHTIYKLVKGSPRVSRLPILFISQLISPEMLLVRCGKVCLLVDRKMLTYHSIATTMALSCLAAYVLQLAVMRLLAWKQVDKSAETQATVLPMCIRPDNATGSPATVDVGNLPRTTTTDTHQGTPVAPAPQSPVSTAAPSAQITSTNQSNPLVKLDGKDPRLPKQDVPSPAPVQPPETLISRIKRLLEQVARELLLFPLRVLVMTLHYMGLFNERGESFFEFTSDAQSGESQLHRQPIRLRLYTTAVQLFQFFERYIIMLVLRLPVEFCRLCNESCEYYGRKMGSLSKDTTMNAFTIFNIATMMLYYLVAFDGKGTSSPGWTDSLG